MIKLVIFDLDGTLIKTISDITEAVNFALKNNGLNELEEKEVQYMVGKGVDHLISSCIEYNIDSESLDKRSIHNKSFDNNLFSKVKEAYLEKYHLICHNNSFVYKGIIELIKQLRQRHIKLAIVSNKPQVETDEVINYYFGRNIFDIVIGQTEFSNKKPNPEGILTILNKLSINKEETLYVGDTETDILTAENADVKCVGVTWGYRKKEEIIDADFIINHPQDLLKLVNGKSGIILLNKEQGITSQNAINKVKKLLNINKIGHAGTLDPLATGLLVVLVNDSTKLSDYLMSNEKEYICEIAIGRSTDTEDCEGNIIDEILDVNIKEEEIDSVLSKQKGISKQIPPMYSSIKKDGKKLYELARKGITIERNERQIEIKEIKRISEITKKSGMIYFTFKALVSKGTYLRSLCVKIGADLGFPAHMNKLNRISSGHFKIDNAYSLSDIENKEYKLISMIEAMQDYYIYHIDDIQKIDVLNGKNIKINDPNILNLNTIVLENNNELIAIYERIDNEFKAKRVWN